MDGASGVGRESGRPELSSGSSAPPRIGADADEPSGQRGANALVLVPPKSFASPSGAGGVRRVAALRPSAFRGARAFSRGGRRAPPVLVERRAVARPGLPPRRRPTASSPCPYPSLSGAGGTLRGTDTSPPSSLRTPLPPGTARPGAARTSPPGCRTRRPRSRARPP